MLEYRDDNESGKNKFCSDLACERRAADTSIDGVEYKKEYSDGFVWERIRISSQAGARSIGRPIGSYDTLNLGRAELLDSEDIDDAANEVARELCIMLDSVRALPDRLLFVGLGNATLTPDAIGPRTAMGINATMHLKALERPSFSDFGCSEIAVCTPGVMAQSGMEAAEVIRGVCERIAPDAVFVIDSLASRSPSRLGSTIQISNTGIFPGSGIGNRRAPIDEALLGAPVIAIGVPTVIRASLLVGEAEMAGTDDGELGKLFVSPREIDEIVNSCSKILSRGINQAFGIL